MPCILSQQQDESMLLQNSCKMMARALPGLILVLLKGQGCAAYSGLHYMGPLGSSSRNIRSVLCFSHAHLLFFIILFHSL